MVKILSLGEKVLEEVCDPVDVENITSDEIKGIIKDMRTALVSQDDGLAIAAPQIGIKKRIFIVSGRIKNKDFLEGKDLAFELTANDTIYINPKIIKSSKKMINKKGEGCLSVRWLYGTVKRYSTVTIEYYDENGILKKEKMSGMIGHICQHEIDHLDGILFIKKATDLEEIKSENAK